MMMDATTPFAALACVLVAGGTAWLLQRRFGLDSEVGRFVCVDGLRGLLALFVFIHHGAYWFAYSRGAWTLDSRFYSHLGVTSVVLFFMITSFLFVRKLTRGPVQWRTLYVHRIFRLTPLYVVVVCGVFVVVGFLSGWQRHESVLRIARECLEWLAFCVFGQHDINAVPNTQFIVAGVPWSLTFEWLFYWALPIMALFIRVPVPRIYVWTSLAVIGCIAFVEPVLWKFFVFIGGAIATYLVERGRLAAFARSWHGSAVATIALAATVLWTDSPYELLSMTLLTLVFVLIACGCDFFGLLRRRFALLLGEIAYSVYLLHGLILYVAFRFVLDVSNFGPLAYWSVVIVLTPLVVTLSYLSFRWIEKPGIQLGGLVDAWMGRTRVTGSSINGPAIDRVRTG